MAYKLLSPSQSHVNMVTTYVIESSKVHYGWRGVVGLTHKLSVVGSNPIKGSHCFLEILYPHCLVPVGSGNGFERDFTIKYPVKYRQNQNSLLRPPHCLP